MPEWIAAKDVAPELEGRRAWIWKDWLGYADIDWIPRGFSRKPEHCEGIFMMPIDPPPIPAGAKPSGNRVADTVDDAERYLLRQQIASILDHPSVYMGGPSQPSIRKAIRIIQAMTDDFEIFPRDKLLPDVERVKSWRTSPWDSLDRT